MATIVSLARFILIERLLRRIIIEGDSLLTMGVSLVSSPAGDILLTSPLTVNLAEDSSIEPNIPLTSGLGKKISLQSKLES